MKTLTTLSELHSWLSENPNPAFVPTMGALHKGHLSLLKAAKKTGSPVLVSVFVNPRQFGPSEDFEKYPRDAEGDTKKLESASADAVWFPREEEIYPNKSPVHRIQNTEKQLPLPSVFSELEGEIRPTHFLGVAQVVSRLFDIIKPSSAFFGQKDYQQTVLIKWLVSSQGTGNREQGTDVPIKIVVCPIIREKNGLAMSSRNEYLSSGLREAAAVLHQSLLQTKEEFDSVGTRRSASDYEQIVRNVLNQEKHVESIDYIEIRDAETLEKIPKIIKPAVILLVARIGSVRLLDNELLIPPSSA